MQFDILYNFNKCFNTIQYPLTHEIMQMEERSRLENGIYHPISPMPLRCLWLSDIFVSLYSEKTVP